MKHYHFSKSDTSIAKLIAITLMLLHHLFGFTDRILPENMYQSLYMFRGQPIEAAICASFKVCVAFFLFLSGYGTYLSLRKSKSISKMIANRIFRFLKYIWQVMIIFVPIDFILGVTKVNLTSSWTIQYDFESIILSMLGFEKYNGEWWFVMPYIFLLIMTPLMFRFLQRKKADFAKYQVFSYYHQILPKGILSYPVLLFVAAAGFYMRYKLGSSYDFFLVGPMIYACVMLIKKIPGVIWVSKKAGRYITFVWLIHSFYVFQFGQKFIYSFGNPILIFIVLAVVSFASAAAVYWLFTGLSKGVKKIRCFHNRTV